MANTRGRGANNLSEFSHAALVDVAADVEDVFRKDCGQMLPIYYFDVIAREVFGQHVHQLIRTWPARRPKGDAFGLNPKCRGAS